MYVVYVTQAIPTDIFTSPISSERDGSALFASSSSCRDCDLKTTLIKLRCSSNYWESRHRDAVLRETRLKEEIENLQARIRYLTQQLYGRKSERHFASEAAETAQPTRHRGHQAGHAGHGRRDYSLLPVRESTLSLDEDARVCARCGLPFDDFPGTEDSEEIVIDVQAYRRVVRRRRYTPRCTCACNAGIITAPLPPKLIPRSKIDISVWVHVLIEKYQYQRPLNRVLATLSDFGAAFPCGTICDGLARLAPLFEPVREAIHEESLREKWWHADETRWTVIEMTEEKQSHRWYVWVFVSSSTAVYVLAPGRDADVVDAFFGPVQKGYLCVDRYSSYKCFVKTRSGFVLVFCWVHVRRDFLEVGRGRPQLEAWSNQWVRHIGELFHLNKERIRHPLNSASFTQADARLRQALTDMSEQRDHELKQADLHPECRKALTSLRNHWQGLTVFVDNPHLPMDNSEAERQLRNSAVGRKNYYGSATIDSGYFTVTMFTIIQTLLRWKINPRLWLTEYLRACAQNGAKSPAKVRNFLPWKMSKQALAQYSSPFPAKTDSS